MEIFVNTLMLDEISLVYHLEFPVFLKFRDSAKTQKLKYLENEIKIHLSFIKSYIMVKNSFLADATFNPYNL